MTIKQDSNLAGSRIILDDTILKNIVKHVKEEVNSYDILYKQTKQANSRINFLEKNGGRDSEKEKEELTKKIEENRMSLRKMEDDNKAGNLVKVIIEKVFKVDSVIGNVRPVKDEIGVEDYIQKMIDRHFYLNNIRNKSVESPFKQTKKDIAAEK